MLLEEFDVKKYERTLRGEGHEEGLREGMEQGIRCMVEALQEAGQSEAYAADKIVEKYVLSKAEAEKKVSQYWK